jgi:hypothetical protein
MKQTLRWATINTLFAAVLYFAFVQNVAGAQNVVQFYAWFGFAISLLMLVPAAHEALAKSPEKIPGSLHRTIDVTYDTAVVIILVWVGWQWTAAAYLLHIFLMQSMITRAKESIFDTLKNVG